MQQITCSSCAYYKQHYAFNGRKIFRVYYGHCTYLRARPKKPDAKACKNHVQGDADENAFVTKEFLSKALLEYMLRLDLLPEIYNERKGEE